MAVTDPKFAMADKNILAPALQFTAITPSDATDFTFGLTRGIYVGVGGNIVAVDATSTAVTFKGATAGSVIPIRASRVNSTNTTATDLVALY